MISNDIFPDGTITSLVNVWVHFGAPLEYYCKEGERNLKLHNSLSQLTYPKISMHLRHNSLSGDLFTKVMTLLQDPILASVTHLDLSKNNFGDLGAINLASYFKARPLIIDLQLSECGMTTLSIQTLASSLKASSLQNLDLSYNPLGDQGMMALSEGIKGLSSLRILNLSGCNIETKGGATLGKILACTNSLEILQLKNNSLTDEGIKDIVTALKINSSLKELDLSQTNAGDLTVTRLYQHKVKLKNSLAVDLSWNHIASDGFNVIKKLLNEEIPCHTLNFIGSFFSGINCRNQKQSPLSDSPPSDFSPHDHHYRISKYEICFYGTTIKTQILSAKSIEIQENPIFEVNKLFLALKEKACFNKITLQRVNLKGQMGQTLLKTLSQFKIESLTLLNNTLEAFA